jgi:pyruvate/2-oxoglutarate dehydrogenase complex dihydrolipoamide acyltransferase (E2) component
MAVYLTLFFPGDKSGTLKKWLMKMGSELHAGDPLFTYSDGAANERYLTPAAGTLKVYLQREGEDLSPGCEVAVLLSSESEAQALAAKKLGHILTPEEYKTALEHAEEASIPLPPDL